MGILWADGFDGYSAGGANDTGGDNMLDGLYAQLTTGINGFRVRNLNPRTGTCALRMGNTGAQPQCRRILGPGIERQTLGYACAMYIDSLPTNSDTFYIVRFRDAANATQLSIGLTSTGAISVYRGTLAGTLLETSGSGAIVAQAYQHIEAKVYIHSTDGYVEVRVDGQTVIDISDVNTAGTADVMIAQLLLLGTQGATGNGAHPVDLDDVVVWDTNGAGNADFLGDCRVYTHVPTDDEVLTMTSTEATGWEAVDEIPPDNETSYVEAGAPGDIAQFAIGEIPAEVTQVLGVMTVHRSRKTDAGPCTFSSGVVSGAEQAMGPDRPLTEEWTYFFETFDLDPATNAPWTPESRNAVNIKIERTDE